MHTVRTYLPRPCSRVPRSGAEMEQARGNRRVSGVKGVEVKDPGALRQSKRRRCSGEGWGAGPSGGAGGFKGIKLYL